MMRSMFVILALLAFAGCGRGVRREVTAWTPHGTYRCLGAEVHGEVLRFEFLGEDGSYRVVHASGEWQLEESFTGEDGGPAIPRRGRRVER